MAATPEERVRQKLIAQMIGALQYPKGLLAVEKKLGACAQLLPDVDPHRRIDLLCFTPKKEGLIPLLLIECKGEGGDSEDEAEKQLLGYNQWISAPFLAIARPNGIKMFWKEKEHVRSVLFLPSYPELVASL